MLEARKLARSLEADPKKRFPSDVSCAFVPAAWLKALPKIDGSIDRRVWEIALAVIFRRRVQQISIVLFSGVFAVERLLSAVSFRFPAIYLMD